jgi:hypothetical protein
MYHRSIALVALLCFILGESGCASWKITRIESPESKKDYQEVVMPLQTGSVLHRRTYVRRGPETKKKSSAKKQKSSAKPEAEPSPTPEEESTPGADRFR